MARIAIRDLDHVTTVSHEEMMAVYGGLDWGRLLNRAWDFARGYLNRNPVQYRFRAGGFDLGVGLNGDGVRFGGQRGGFQFGFGFNW